MEAARETEILISATSPVSFEDAINQAVARATATLRGVHDVQVRQQRTLLEGSNIVGYQVYLVVVFDAEPEEGGGRLGVMLDPEEYRRLVEAEEELEDLRAYDEAVEELRTGEDELVPWKNAELEIEKERDDLRRHGEL